LNDVVQTGTRKKMQFKVLGLLVILLQLREFQGGWRHQGRYVNSNLQKTASFIVVESLGVPPEHTQLHPARCLDTSGRFPPVGNVFLSFFNQALLQIQRQAGIA
jgi:hypothetical protein